MSNRRSRTTVQLPSENGTPLSFPVAGNHTVFGCYEEDSTVAARQCSSDTSSNVHLQREMNVQNGGVPLQQKADLVQGTSTVTGSRWMTSALVKLAACTAAGVVFGFAAEKAKGLY